MAASVVEFAARVAGVDPGAVAQASSTEGLTHAGAMLRAIVESGAGGALSKDARARWLGRSDAEQSLAAQWMELAATSLEPAPGEQDAAPGSVGRALVVLDEHLQRFAFLVAPAHPTFADLRVYWALARAGAVREAMVATHPGLSRWFDTLQNMPAVRDAAGDALPLVAFSLPDAWAALTGAAKGAEGAEGAPKKEGKKGASGKKDAAGKKKDTAGKKKDGASAAGKKDAAAAEKKGGAAAKKGVTVAETPLAAASDDQPEATKLDIRVGKITKIWRHPESDKLFCEEIDVGEDAPRPIASGLAPFYSDHTTLEGKHVLVMCNLKPRKLANFKSNGMVLCASNADHTQVELVDVPEGAKVGERITFAGVEGGPYEPFAPNALAKKKVLEAVLPTLKTTANREPCWLGPSGKEHLFTTSAGTCSVPTIAGGSVA